MTIQTTNIDKTSGDAVDLTAGEEFFYTIANGVLLESQTADGVVADSTQAFLVYNYGGVIANGDGVVLEAANDHLYNESSGSIFGFYGVFMGDSIDETVVNYGNISGDIVGIGDSQGGNVISNYGTIEGPDDGLSVAGGDYITNYGIISATTGVGISTDTATTLTTIINTGAIEGGDAISSLGTGALTLTNTGALDGAVDLENSGGDTFTNTGEIVGTVQLGGGTNTFDNRHGGTVTGTITGGAGVDTIYLGNDGETVDGGGAHDKIYGGTGADTFVLSSDLGADWEHIYNFGVADDTIELEHSVFTKLKAGATPTFSIASAATSPTDFLYYNSANGDLYYDTNGNASGGTHLIAELTAGLKLTASNFTVV